MRYSKSQFHFELKGYGCYEVTYCTNSRGDYHTAIINSMPLIDAVKHEDEPTQDAMRRLRYNIVGGCGLNHRHYSADGVRLDY